MRISLAVLAGLFLSFSEGVAQESKVRVIVDRASIYAESSTESYRIETVKKGTILTLFGLKQADKNWYYVYYQSPRWRSKVTGFIQKKMVEAFAEAEKAEGERVERPEEKPEIKTGKKEKAEPVVKPEEKKAVEEPVKKPEKEPKQPEIKQEPVKIERTLALTPVLSHKTFPSPLSFPLGKSPRAFGVTTEEELESEVLPAGEKLVVQPLLTLSLGYGPSLGGFGGFIQLNTSGALSVHWGFGYYPTSIFYPDFDWVKGKALFSFGVKYYLPWRSQHVRPYVDLQYGGLSVEAVRIVTGIWYYTYVYEEFQKTLWGPSILAGVELRFGSFGLNGAVGASYVVTKWEYWDQSLFVTADLSFLFYF